MEVVSASVLVSTDRWEFVCGEFVCGLVTWSGYVVFWLRGGTGHVMRLRVPVVTACLLIAANCSKLFLEMVLCHTQSMAVKGPLCP